MTRKAFTLPELLVSLAIIVILAAVLLPVFRAVKSSANRTVCLSNFRQTYAATTLYTGDYDDIFMPINYSPGSGPEFQVPSGANSRNDRTWVQMILPYAGSFSLFRCPSDYGIRPKAETTFDQDLIPGDIYSQYYTASLRSNLGYNYLYLSPIEHVGGHYYPRPHSQSSDIVNPSNTILFVDSVWARKADGTPYGGGRWLVSPPCRYEGPQRKDTMQYGNALFAFWQGWDASSYSSIEYGGAWPWHDGRMNVVRVDGSIASISPGRLAAGCSGGSSWAGTITDKDLYMWDIH